MPWAKVDDTLHSHPKARRAGLPALGLHLLALSYCAQYLTDGFIDREWVELQGRGAKGYADKLVCAGLWEDDAEGYWIHDWLVYNPSRAETLARREARAAAGAKGGRAKWANANGQAHA